MSFFTRISYRLQSLADQWISFTQYTRFTDTVSLANLS